MRIILRRAGLSFLAWVLLGGLVSNCTKMTTADDVEVLSPGTLSWKQIGPKGGFIAAVQFQPNKTGVVWASADDGSGIYKSTDFGASWNLVNVGSQNQSTYSLRFDPNDPNKIFAPNHFGRGMLMSTDSGETWTASQAGLPLVGNNDQLLYDLAIDPTDSKIIFAATDSGLFKSINGGISFTAITVSFPGVQKYRSVAFRQDGILFVGTSDGVMGFTPDKGSTWTPLLSTPNGVSVDFLVFSSSSLYVGFKSAAIFRLDKNTFAGGLINNPSLAGSILNSNKIVFAVKSGATPTNDVLYVGTSGQSTFASSRYGLFKSTNSGASWSQPMLGMEGNYIMSVAVDPNNVDRVVVGSTNGNGVHYTLTGGDSWIQANNSIYGTTSLGLAQDPNDPKTILSSTTACGGFSANYKTTDGGETWTKFADPVADDGVFAFDIDPSNSKNVLAASCTKGVLRSTNGTSGPWLQVAASTAYVDRIHREHANSAKMYLVVPGGAVDKSLYYSSNGGVSFVPRTGTIAWAIDSHPSRAGEILIATGDDVYVSLDSGVTKTSLGLSSFAASEGGFNSVTFNQNNPSEVVVGGGKGGIFKTTKYANSGVGVSWSKLSTPIVSAGIRDVVVTTRGGRTIYYAVTFGGQTSFAANSTIGAFRSLDAGLTWTTISTTMNPGTIFWRLVPDITSPTTTFLAGMWAPGLFKLVDTE